MTNASGVLAADFGETHVSCAAIENSRILEVETVAVRGRRSLGALLPEPAGVLRRLRATLRSSSGLGVSFCGVVDPHRVAILATPQGKYDDSRPLNLPSWRLEPIGVPMRMENDARMALPGVGGAAMIGGCLLRGRRFQAGCLGGHLPARSAFDPFVVRYAETFIVPAAVGPYTIAPATDVKHEIATIKVFVR